MRERSFLLAVFLAVLVLALPTIALSCAVCLTGAANDPVADALNWSVLFLMATPYTVVGLVAGWLAYTHWRAAARKNGGERKKTPILSLAWIHKESGR